MSILFYVVPLMIAVGATDYTQQEWIDGHLGAVAVDIGGKWLGALTVFAAGISNLALFEAKLSADSFQLMVRVFWHLTFMITSVFLHISHISYRAWLIEATSQRYSDTSQSMERHHTAYCLGQ